MVSAWSKAEAVRSRTSARTSVLAIIVHQYQVRRTHTIQFVEWDKFTRQARREDIETQQKRLNLLLGKFSSSPFCRGTKNWKGSNSSRRLPWVGNLVIDEVKPQLCRGGCRTLVVEERKKNRSCYFDRNFQSLAFSIIISWNFFQSRLQLLCM